MDDNIGAEIPDEYFDLNIIATSPAGVLVGIRNTRITITDDDGKELW